jgi:hypothetical protein
MHEHTREKTSQLAMSAYQDHDFDVSAVAAAVQPEGAGSGSPANVD